MKIIPVFDVDTSKSEIEPGPHHMLLFATAVRGHKGVANAPEAAIVIGLLSFVLYEVQIW